MRSKVRYCYLTLVRREKEEVVAEEETDEEDEGEAEEEILRSMRYKRRAEEEQAEERRGREHLGEGLGSSSRRVISTISQSTERWRGRKEGEHRLLLLEERLS